MPLRRWTSDRFLPATLIVLATASSTALAQRGGCLNDAEKLMRDLQALANGAAGSNAGRGSPDDPDNPNNVDDNPPECPDEKGPAFPPDGYYNRSLNGPGGGGGDGDAAAALVRKMMKKMCDINNSSPHGASLLPLPLSDFFVSPATEPPDSGDPSVMPEKLPEQFGLGEWCTKPITPENYCDALDEIRRRLRDIDTMIVPPEHTTSLNTRGMHANSELNHRVTAQPPNATFDGECDDVLELCYLRESKSDSADAAKAGLDCKWSRMEESTCGGLPYIFDGGQSSQISTGVAGETCGVLWCGGPNDPCPPGVPWWSWRARGYCIGDSVFVRGDFLQQGSVFTKFDPQPEGADSPYQPPGALIAGLPFTVCEGIEGPKRWPAAQVQSIGRSASSITMGTGNFSLFKGTIANFGGSGCGIGPLPLVEETPTGNRGWSLTNRVMTFRPALDSRPERLRSQSCSSCKQQGPGIAVGPAEVSWALAPRAPFGIKRDGGYLLLRVGRIDGVQPEQGPAYPDNVIRPNRFIRNFDLEGWNSPGRAGMSYAATPSDPQQPGVRPWGGLQTFTFANGASTISASSQSAEPGFVYRTLVTLTTSGVDGTAWTQQTYIDQGVSGDPLSPTAVHTLRFSHTDTRTPGETRRWLYVKTGDNWELRESLDENFAQPKRRFTEVVTITPTTPSTLEMRTTVATQFDEAGVAVSGETTIETNFPWGWERTEHWLGTDLPNAIGGELSERREFITIPSTPGYGKLAMVFSRDGSWQKYSYTQTGEIAKIVSQHLSNAPTTADNQNREVVFERGLIHELGGFVKLDPITNLPESIGNFVDRQERLLGQPVARTIQAWAHNGGLSYEISIRCADPNPATQQALDLIPQYVQDWNSLSGPQWTDSNIVTVNLRSRAMPQNIPAHNVQNYHDHYLRTELVSSRRSDGTVTTYTSGNGGYVPPAAGAEPEITRLSATSKLWFNPLTPSDPGVLQLVRETQTTTQLRNGAVIEDKTLESSGGPPVLTRHLVSNPTTDIDSQGRTLKVTDVLAGTSTRTHYGCCGIEWEEGADGVRTSYEYDNLKRLWKTKQQVGPAATDVITTETVYDGADRAVETWRTPAGGGTPVLLSRQGYSTSGRLLWTETQGTAGRIDYAHGWLMDPTGKFALGRFEQETLQDPDGMGPQGRPVTERWMFGNGQQQSVGGSAALPESYDIGVAAPGSGSLAVQYSTVYRGTTNPATATNWVRTWTDALGRTVAVQNADLTFSQVSYDTLGRAFRRTTESGLTTLTFDGFREVGLPAGAPGYPFLWEGSWTIQAQSAQGGSAIDWANDRITISKTYLTNREIAPGTTVPVRRTSVYTLPNSGDPTTTVLISETDQSLDGMSTWSTTDGLTTTSHTDNLPLMKRVVTNTTGPNGDTTSETTEYGRSIKTQVLRDDVPFSELNTTYDGHGRVSSTTFQELLTTPPSFATTTYTYDSADRVDSTTGPAPDHTQPTVNRQYTTAEYDTLGRVTRTTAGPVGGPVASEVLTEYNERGQTIAQHGSGATPVRMEYDDLGRMTVLKTYRAWGAQSEPSITTFVFDPVRGWLNTKLDHTGNGPTYTYLPDGRLSSRTWARGVSTNYGYDSFGALASMEHSDGTPGVMLTFDRLGRLATATDAAGECVYGYEDTSSRVLTETYATGSGIHRSGVLITNQYSPTTHLRTNHAAEVAGYSASVGYTYDSRWRLHTVSKNNGHVEYGYNDATGALVKIENSIDPIPGAVPAGPSIRNLRTYDRLGRILTSKTYNLYLSSGLPFDDRGVEYDVLGRRDRETVAGTLGWEYEHDARGQLIEAYQKAAPYITFMPGSFHSYAYDDIGNRTSVGTGGNSTGGDLISSSYTSNALNQYTERQVPGSTEVIGYGFTASPNMINVYSDQETLGLANVAFRAPKVAPAPLNYIFHRRVPLPNAVNPLLTNINVFENLGALTSSWPVYRAKTPEEMTYDLDGNLKTDGLWTYSWDAENRLTSMQLRTEAAWVLFNDAGYVLRLIFAYDWQGRRIMKSIEKTNSDPTTIEADGTQITWEQMGSTQYVYDGWLLTLAYTANNLNEFVSPWQSFAWGPDLSGTRGGAGGIGGLAIYSSDTPLSPYSAIFPVYDTNAGGSSVTGLYRVTTNSSNVYTLEKMATYTYGPFGETKSIEGRNGQGTLFPFRYSTKFTDDETGLVWYGYRYFAPGLGRWISRDPIGEADGNNQLTFVHNSPLQNTDPNGLWTRNADWDGAAYEYEGTATAESGDDYGSLSYLILGTSELGKFLGSGTPECGEVVDVSLLLAALEAKLRNRIVNRTKRNRITTPFQTGQPLTNSDWSSKNVLSYFAFPVCTPGADCGLTVRLVMHAGAIDEIGSHLYDSLRVKPIRMKTRTISGRSNLLPGDWAVILNNPNYTTWRLATTRSRGAFSQENALYAGAGKWFGLPFGNTTEAKIIEHMRSELRLIVPNGVDADSVVIPGLDFTNIRFFDVPKLAEALFDLRKQQ